ncbi:MAG: zinc-ribbon domain-containing protein, partial [Bryobacteraceae bacterium]
MFCVNCGSQIDETAAFCVSCGNRIHRDAPPPQQSQPQPAAPPPPRPSAPPPPPSIPHAQAQTKCAWCGAAVDANQRSCPLCGATLDTPSLVTRSGWAQLPGRKDMAKLQFG